MTATVNLHATFQNAEGRWLEEVERTYGVSARYEKRARGEAGSKLRQLYDAKTEAWGAFTAARRTQPPAA